MDELRGPNIQIVLHVKEGLGFGFLRIPFVVSGSLNGYMLETDPVVPTHAPAFDAELVWEADKRRFRSLRVQNVPIKVEVFTTSTQGRKDKIGYILLSLLGAQPCPSNKIVDVKYSWHKLLGIKSEGKCCHPQLLMSLSIEDRVNTLTPRNELRMFHSNEVAYPLSHTPNSAQTNGPVLLTLNEYINESKKVVSSPDLQPQLKCEEGLIQIGAGDQLYVLSFVIGSVENLDLLLPNDINKEAIDCCVTYSIFTHNIMTDRVGATSLSTGSSALFNQRTSLRLRTDLVSLSRYFADCPHLVVRVCVADRDVGICSLDLRKLIPTEDVKRFISEFCNSDDRLVIHERCYMLRCDDAPQISARRPYMDVEISLKYIGIKSDNQKPNILTARSVTQLERRCTEANYGDGTTLDYRSGSCTQIDPDVGGVAYTNKSAGNTARYKTANGENVLQTSEITELLRKMCDSFAQSQEKMSHSRPFTSDMQVQCGPELETYEDMKPERDGEVGKKREEQENAENTHIQPNCETAKEQNAYSVPQSEKDLVKQVLPAVDRDAIMQKFINELEDWKERQQELFKCQLRRKEEYHLELLSREWEKRRVELESKLSRGVERCRTLANDLSRATEDFRLRGYRNTERERKLLEAKKALEAHYTAKYQELREASQKMEDDMHHQIKLKDMRIEELELKVQQLEKNIEVLKNNLRNMEKDAESKHSGLTKDQTASLIQELRCLEEKLDSAVQSKAFFKEQWGRAVRELHLTKMSSRRHMLSQLRREKSRLNQVGLDTIDDYEMNRAEDLNETDIKKLKDDFYADLLANTPPLESHSAISVPGPEGLDMFMDMKNASKNSINDKLNELISQRDQLIQQDNPDEATLKQLNNEIRSILINCGT